MIGIRSISSSKLKRLLPLCRSVCTYTDSVSNTLHKPQLKQNYSLNPSKTLIPFYSFRHFCSSTSVILSRDGNYDESTSKKFPICLGCGVRMQDSDSEQPGFFIQPKPKSPNYKYRLGNTLITDESEISEALEKGVVTDLTTGKEEDIVEDIETQNPKLTLVCARCHSLRNYGKVKNPEVENLLPDFDFNHTVGKRFSSVTGPRTVVLMVVDASDFDGSFPRKVAKLVSETIDEHSASWKKGEPGNVPRVVLVVTKINLLPSSLNPTGLEHWVRTRAREGGASKLTSVHLVSAVKDWDLSKAHQMADPDLEAVDQTASIFRKFDLNQREAKQVNNIQKSLRIVVVGDIHEEWNHSVDELALQFLQPDLVLFTGDIGNENVELVRCVASLKMPKAVILGNHDSWKTQKIHTKVKDNIQLMLECLGEEHVGYSRLDFPMLKLSVVGGRPFSAGGNQLFRKRLLSQRYGIKDMEGSAKLIAKAASGTPEDHLVIFLAHNGPTGLGSNANDICGIDWIDGGGDHGDPDLAEAISYLKDTTELSIALVVFGHMHKELENGDRKMIVFGDDNIVHVNGAIVPRAKDISNKGSARAFTVIEFVGDKLSRVVETWILVDDCDQVSVEDEQILFASD